MPKNILLDAKGFLKITHFSTARYYTIPIPPFTPCDIDVTYKSPECLLKAERYGPPSDLWSVGCVIAQMVTPERVPIFNGDSQIDQIAKIYQILGTPDDSVWDEFSLLDSIPNIDSYTKKNLVDFIAEPYSKDDNLIDLLEKLFIYDPSKRISAEEAINHPFFNEIHPNLRAFCCGTAGQGNSAN
ncbi:Cyclin-dependent kinase 1 [Histomonas meleagridis]|uniref:Cyclin-dependent kinase 1 n=1 Tax=Histomonas meleagridis TaxID=135588 RepID=UPI00355AA7D8|nr:Cyclin-dependent kinase 1 [Histomonas meleagridis]KAH0805494.1 Cyclin-dependent kinase 1 [Histomonas meleagridis]